MSEGIYKSVFGLMDSGFVKEIAVNARLKQMRMPIERVARDYWLSHFVSSGEWAEKEVQTEVGRIDLLTKEFIFEFKQIKKWKEGLGQLLVYSHYYPECAKVLYLVGAATESYKALIDEHCKRLGVIAQVSDVDVSLLKELLQSQAKDALRKRLDSPVFEQQKIPMEDS